MAVRLQRIAWSVVRITLANVLTCE
jgi:hypothetical protein